MSSTPKHHGAARRSIKIFLIIAVVIIPNLMILWSTSAQSATTSSFGVGRGHGPEVGINVDVLNAIRTDINNGVYDRPCTAAEHDRTKWHSLVNLEARCHYDHHHGDDPNYVNDIFGDPGAFFGRPGNSVSYPWQTFKAQTATEPNDQYVANQQMENDLKHEGYTWIVRRDQPCPTGQNCTIDFRLQFHGIMGAHDAVVRWHSYSYEGRLCQNPNDASTCGIIRLGGWTDFGRLFITNPGDINCEHDVNEIFIPLAADTLYLALDRPESRDEVRCHPTLTELPPQPSSRPLAEWWSLMHGRFRFQVRSFDPIGNVRQDAPDQWLFHCTLEDVNCRYDQTMWSAWIGYVTHIPEFPDYGKFGHINVDSDRNGRTDFRGWMSRLGELMNNCPQASLDCVPLIYDNVILNAFQNKEALYNHHPCTDCPRVDHDISPAGKKWNTWFFTKYQGGHGGHEPTPTPEPVGPAVLVDVDNPSATVGQTINVNLKLLDVEDVYGLQAQCTVNPAVLSGTTLTKGDGFNDSNSFYVDSGYQQDGKWTVAASRKHPEAAISGDATAFTLGYNVVGAGDGQLVCSAMAVDQDGNDLELPVINGSYTSQTPTPEPTTETPPPPSETPTPDPDMLGTITGVAAFQNRPDSAGISVDLYDEINGTEFEVMTDASGAFSFGDLPAATYTLVMYAPQHLPTVQTVEVDGSGNTVNVGEVILRSGDTDDNGIVDVTDATFVGANFGVAVPPAPNNADLNGDASVNVSDLVLVGGNFGMTSPLPE